MKKSNAEAQYQEPLAEVRIKARDLNAWVNDEGDVIMTVPIRHADGKAIAILVEDHLPDASRPEQLRLGDEIAELIWKTTLSSFILSRI